ncbi:MAG: MBL fold metallo-hydrolase [Anaerolineaceae bacterium]|nr:MBL fold metallo-hydrolase [Anaerolineaceae bacterium]
MPQVIKTLISKTMNIAVNCYLVQSGGGFFLIDTGWAKKQDDLVRDLEIAGCSPENLKLIILTHGDFDHSGNGAYLRQKYGAKIGMHTGDLENVESGDLFANKKINPVTKVIAKTLFSVTGLAVFTTFTPDLFLKDGQDLSMYGWEAAVIHLPGHSTGSIGILSSNGDLFCGDLLVNTKKPALNTLGDNFTEMKTSLEKLKSLPIKTVYPGHGSPFPMDKLSIE